MANLSGTPTSGTSSGGTIPGRQAYHLDIPSTASASDASVVSFEATERMGAPTEVRITFTHPDALPRADYLNREASFSISPVGDDPRKFSGFIARFSKLKTTADFSLYEVVLASHFARLCAVRTSRLYQHKTTPQIIESILRSHELEGYQFAFNLRAQYPQHDFRFQRDVDDLTYVQMLMQKAGIYSYIVETEYGDQIVFGDDIDHYIYQPSLSVPYRETAGLEAGVESISSIKTHTQTVAQSVMVADYNPDQAWERFRDQANVAPQDGTTYGQPYIFGTHHLDQAGAKREAQLRHEVAIAWQVVCEGEGNVTALQPARILRMEDVTLEDAPDGLVMIEVTHRGARDKSYTNIFRAIPADRRFRLKLEEEKWPKISGTMSARVTSPDQYKYAYQNAVGYYTVRLDPDFADWPAGGESVPLRLAKPFAGALQTGFHFPALDGTEAVIEFRDGDPDKPYIAAFHHNSQAVDLITNDRRWLSRNVIRTQSNNKLRMEDWSGQEGIKLSTEYGKSQLNLGYLVDSQLGKRGEGFELRTDNYGMVRGGQGLFLSADVQNRATGQALDMQVAMQQLETAAARMKSLAEAVQQAKAVVAACEEQKALLEEKVNGLKQAVLVASAPQGMALTSGGHLQVAAGMHLFTTAGGNVDTGAGGNYTVAAGNGVSLYANTQGMKLYAGKGAVQVQAQADALELTGSKDVSVTSANGKVVLTGKEEVWIGAGGSYIQINASGIQNVTTGEIVEKCASWDKTGPGSQRGPLPALPAQQGTTMQLWHTYDNGEPVRHAAYTVLFADGSERQGKLGGDGRASVADAPRGGGTVEYFEEGSALDSEAHPFPPPPQAQGQVQQTGAGGAGQTPGLPDMLGGSLAGALGGALPGVLSGGGAGSVLGSLEGAGAGVLKNLGSSGIQSALGGMGLGGTALGSLAGAAASAAAGSAMSSVLGQAGGSAATTAATTATAMPAAGSLAGTGAQAAPVSGGVQPVQPTQPAKPGGISLGPKPR